MQLKLVLHTALKKKDVYKLSIKTTNIYPVWRGCVLLIRRSPKDPCNPLMWECPGGHVDLDCGDFDNLSLRIEALRELKEETGVVSEPKDLIALPKVGYHQPYILNFATKMPPTIKLSNEHDLFKWHSMVSKVTNSPMRKEVFSFIHKNKLRMLR